MAAKVGVLLSISFVLGACTRLETPAIRFEPEAREIGEAGIDPALHVSSSGRILVLAAEARTAGSLALVLRSSEDGGDSFHELHRLDAGGDVESHGEGRPLLRVGRGGETYVVWSERGDGGKGLLFSRSLDFLHSFSAPVAVSAAGAASFFDLAVAADGRLVLVWLAYDPAPGARPGTASIRLATSGDRGESWSEPARLAIDVCPCCRPRLALGDRASFLSWRGVGDGDVRDVVVASLDEGFTSTGVPAPVSADGWAIDGCPHSGPALAIHGDRLWVAWATGASGTMRAFAASSALVELSFSPRIELASELHDTNHPDLAITPGGLFAAFQARPSEAAQTFAASRAFLVGLAEDGADEPVAAPAAAGSTLYPTVARLGVDQLLVAWTDSTAEGTRIAAARARIPGVPGEQETAP